MAASVTTLTILDGNGTARLVQVLDLSGTGAGPFSFMNNMVDSAGINLLGIDSSGAASTNIAKMNGTVVTMGNGITGTGVQRVTIASDSTGQIALAAGAAAIGTVAITTGIATIGSIASITNALPAGGNAIGTVALTTGTASIGNIASITNALPAGTNALGTVALTTGTTSIGSISSITNAVTVAAATASTLNATVVGTGTFATQATMTPATSGGLSYSSTIITTGTPSVAVKSSAGQLYSIACTNNSATIAYLKLYNLTTATAGSNTPAVRIMIPANANGAGIVVAEDTGIAFSTGISYTVTGGIADADSTSIAGNAYIVNLFYK
jgi:hypothetical protein